MEAARSALTCYQASRSGEADVCRGSSSCSSHEVSTGLKQGNLLVLATAAVVQEGNHQMEGEEEGGEEEENKEEEDDSEDHELMKALAMSMAAVPGADGDNGNLSGSSRSREASSSEVSEAEEDAGGRSDAVEVGQQQRGLKRRRLSLSES